MSALRPVLRPVGAVLVSLACAGAALWALGYPALEALSVLVRGSLGSEAAWTATLLKSAPLLLTGLAVTIPFRCGMWNIGAEGQLYSGALAATLVATRLAPGLPSILLVPLLALLGAAAGAALGAAAGTLRTTRGVSEVITTILLNFIAIQAVALAVHGPLRESTGAYPQSDPLPPAAMLPSLGRIHLGVAIAVIAALASTWVLFRTPLGFRIRAVGLSPLAARFAGIASGAHGVTALAIGGALAGLAGAFEVAGVTGRLYEGLSPGYGYTAIAVALLARLHPLAVVLSALFFGALEAGAGAMQREASVPAVATQMVQGLVILLSVGFALAADRRPAAGRR